MPTGLFSIDVTTTSTLYLEAFKGTMLVGRAQVIARVN
jgi:hypothetical protein